ncbi:MAG: hypothetical protein K2N11_07415 [Mucispirillum sp.]|nr:hypothetical protein [Mucispirillum sp.]
MQNKKLIITLLFAVLSIFTITACSDSSNESNSGVNNGGGGTVQPEPEPEPEPDLNVVKEFYHFLTWADNSNDLYSQYAILYDGSLYAWGNNNHGQLGVGLTDKDVLYQNDKKKVNIPGKVIQLIAENEPVLNSSTSMYDTTSSFYAITENGELYVWGYNGSGQLGVGDKIDRNTPEKINLSGKIKTLKTSEGLVYAILEDGSLYAWGNNYYGQLGVGDDMGRDTPTKVTAITGMIKELITNNYYSTYAIMEDGSLYAWGKNGSGQLGVGDKVNKNTPTLISGISGKIKTLKTNYQSIYAIAEDGLLYTWGRNLHGQLGIYSFGQYINAPKNVKLPNKVKELITSSSSAYTILEDGSLYAWGKNEDGKLGIGLSDGTTIHAPKQVTGINGTIKKLITGSSVYALMEDGSLYVWGKNESSQLGVGDIVNRNTPTKVNLPSKIKELIIDSSSAYAILEDGSLYAWGNNYHGKLGVGKSTNTIYTPEQVTGINGTIKEISNSTSGYDMTIYANGYFLTEDGLLYVTGWEDSNYPVKIEFKEK